MEPDEIDVDGNGKDSTDIGRTKTIRGIEKATDIIGACSVVESSDYASTANDIVGNPTTTDRIDDTVTIPVAEPPRKEEGKEFLNREDACMRGLSATTEADDNNDNLDLSNSIPSANPNEDTKSSVNTALDMGDESKSMGVEGLEEPERKASITSNSFEIEASVAATILASAVAPTDSTIDAAPISSLVNTNCNKEMNIPTHKKSEASHSSPHKDGSPFRSTNNKVNSESVWKTGTNDSLFNHQQKKSSRPTSSDQQGSSSLVVSSLPIDSLHSIASFLISIELKNFGQCNKATNKICREVFRRVRMHGFRCATEVVTAWKFGQHADAKELCALYVSTGVPIYPHSLGHSYHTLVWRLSIEAKHLQEQQEQQQENTKNRSSSSTSTFGKSTPLNMPSITDHPPIDPSAEISALVDLFYNEREAFRMREELIDGFGEGDLTYLEEKTLYNLNAKGNHSEVGLFTRSNWRRTSIDQAHRGARNPLAGGLPHPQGTHQAPHIPPPLPSEGAGAPSARNRWSSLAETGRGTVHHRALTRSNSFSGNRYRAPNVSLKVHRHLLDQHLLGRPGVNDFEGSMTTPPVSLSADFFHPFFSFRSSEEIVRNQSSATQNSGSTAIATSSLLSAYHQFPPATIQQINNDGNHDNIGESSVARGIESMSSNLVDDSDSDAETEIVFPRPLVMEPLRLSNVDEMMAAGATLQPSAMVPPIPPMASLDPNRRLAFASAGIIPEIHTIPHQVTAHNDILSKMDLDVYSASSRSLKSDNNDKKERQLNNYLKARFTAYHCCLERHLSNNDSDGFEETIMDFWDEFSPQTANIQFYDKHTAVPRISRLEKFLTKPCPKQIGIVQCEIERVKLSSKKKGVNMKGRFFPTYEYRLFIRHRPSEPAYAFIDATSNNKNGRRDTVLMMAKNRGRKYSDNTGQASKKGSNNYYLSLPQQNDLDLHYKSVNGLDHPLETSPNGIGTQTGPSEFSGLLGRLQSNFVGTEFQIFTPRSTMKETKAQFFSEKSIAITHSKGTRVTSDDDVFYDNGRQSKLNSISSARPRSRFGRLSLRGRSGNNGDNRTDFLDPFQPRPSSLTLRRSRSSDATPGRNRKVSAAESFFESQHFKAETQSTYFEEEDGAITYTANLLGSRPRIMDVCVPKVNHNGTGIGWRRNLENSEDEDGGTSADRLLNHLKQLQQNSQIEDHGRLVNPANNDAEELGIDEREYFPPGDCGLLALQNRPPWWNVELGSFVLNFGGRVSVASVKNFQLCDRDDQDHIMLQFGRIEGRHSFTMDFQYPLTAVQAFAIAISSLQSKISFG